MLLQQKQKKAEEKAKKAFEKLLELEEQSKLAEKK